MSSPYKPHISPSPRKRINSDKPNHEYLIQLSPSPSNSTMADRFPSLEDFGAGQTSPRNPTADTNSDFLTRERAALGDDAAQFAGANDNAATVEDGGDEDLLGGDGDYEDGGGGGGAHNGNGMMDDFESSFPAVDTRNEAMAPGGTMTGSSTLPFQSGVAAPQPSYGASYGGSMDEDEPEPIRAWRTQRTTTLSQRASLAASKKSSTIAQAQSYVDDFYDGYNARKEKSIAKTRKEAEEFLAKREDTSAGGTSWERIARLLDLGKGAGGMGGKGGEGKERFREVLVGLRGDEGAPGAGGY